MPKLELPLVVLFLFNKKLFNLLNYIISYILKKAALTAA